MDTYAYASEYGQPLRSDQGIPPKIWLRATDILARYIATGEQWVAANRPQCGDLAERFNQVSREYVSITEFIWWAQWTREQAEEWARIWASHGLKVTNFA